MYVFTYARCISLSVETHKNVLFVSISFNSGHYCIGKRKGPKMQSLI